MLSSSNMMQRIQVFCVGSFKILTKSRACLSCRFETMTVSSYALPMTVAMTAGDQRRITRRSMFECLLFERFDYGVSKALLQK